MKHYEKEAHLHLDLQHCKQVRQHNHFLNNYDDPTMVVAVLSLLFPSILLTINYNIFTNNSLLTVPLVGFLPLDHFNWTGPEQCYQRKILQFALYFHCSHKHMLNSLQSL